MDTRVFQLLQWKYAIKLERLGIKHSKGSVTAHAARHFGCKRTEVSARIDEELARYEEQARG